MATVAIIVVSWNTRELLAECLTSIAQFSAPIDVEIVVVDNDSPDGSAAMVRERFPALRLIANHANVGFAPAVNQGVAATDAPYVLVFNSDARLAPDTLSRLLSRLESGPRIGLVGAQLRGRDGAFEYSHTRFPTLRQEALMLSGLGRALYGSWYPSAGPVTDDHARAVDWVGGACMLLRRAAFDAVGGLDEGFALYCEEVDLCLALHRAGWEVWYEPAAVVVHQCGASTFQLGPEREVKLYRSRLRFFRKHHGRWAARLLAAQLVLFTAPKIAIHSVLRRVSGGRLGRDVLSPSALRDAVREPSPAPIADGTARIAGRRRAAACSTLLIATAARPPEHVWDASHTHHPRVDYVELQRRLGVELVDYGLYPGGPAGALLQRAERGMHFDPYLSLHVATHAGRFEQLVCLSERVGLPLAVLHRAGLLRASLAVLFQGWSWRQEALVTRLRLFERLECIGVNCSAMRDHLIQLGAPPARVHTLRWAVDHQFFSPQPEPGDAGVVVSIGEPRHRDYTMLFRAVEALPLDVHVRVAGYPYGHTPAGGTPQHPPGNVRLLSALSFTELRTLYARARVVVLPVPDLIYPAGLTALLEAMSMGRPVIVTRSRGLRDYVIDGETALLVDAADGAGLRDAIRRVTGDRALARRLGEAARARVETELNQVRYIEQLVALLDGPRSGVEIAA